MNTGIYQIKNSINNNIYIGSTVDIKSRWRTHRCTLNLGVHRNVHLQRAWKLYGKENFEFTIICECEVSELISKEQFYIDKLKPEYNILKIAGSTIGHRVSIEARNKISIANKGRKHTDEAKRKIGLAGIGRKKPTKIYDGFIAPDGNEYKFISNLKDFCEGFGLNYNNMNQVDNGHKKVHKGWRRINAGTS